LRGKEKKAKKYLSRSQMAQASGLVELNLFLSRRCAIFLGFGSFIKATGTAYAA
jgi:hypothetical protein